MLGRRVRLLVFEGGARAIGASQHANEGSCEGLWFDSLQILQPHHPRGENTARVRNQRALLTVKSFMESS